MPHVEVNLTESNLETHNYYAPLSDESETDMDMEPSQTDTVRSIANKRKPENPTNSPTSDETTEEDGYKTVKGRKKKKKKTNGEILAAKENTKDEQGNNNLAIASNKAHPNQPAPRPESQRTSPPQRVDEIKELKASDIELTEDQLQAGSVSKLQKIHMVNEVGCIAFECCGLKVPADKFKIISRNDELESVASSKESVKLSNDLQYDEVIFVDCLNERKTCIKNFESVFVNVEEGHNRTSEEKQNYQAKFRKSIDESDPLLVEEKSCQDSISFLEKKLSSNIGLFKITSKNFLPKVVDWTSGAFVNISDKSMASKKAKYPDILICEFCGLQFSGKDRVYKFFYHRNQTHTQEVRYSCPVCQKNYWGERELSAHVACHLGKEHICEICGITFQRKNDLVRHLLTHEEKKFECKFCAKRFRRKDHLGTHVRIHTKNNPFVCQKCNTGFPQKRQLNLHNKKCKAASQMVHLFTGE